MSLPRSGVFIRPIEPPQIAVEAVEVVKDFPATRALDRVSLAFGKGEVHGLIGENGAGKSTLMKILAGLLRPDSGELRVDGMRVNIHSVGDANALGIAMIHQELNLVGSLSVAENIFLGREPRTLGFVRKRAMEAQAASLLVNVGARVDPGTPVSRLSVAEQQLVEIAKALAVDAKFLIMDEPTAVLSARETKALFSLIRRLAANGVTIIYISHLLPEVLSLCSRISVLRDGKLVTTVSPRESTEASLASLMVGRELSDVFPRKAAPPASATPALEVRGLAVAPIVRDFSLTIAQGEIVGLAGLVGSGRTESAEAIVGLRRASSGTMRVFGRELRFAHPREALAAGVAYVSEDRKQRGVHLDMSCVSNVTLAHLGAYGWIFPNRGQERASARRWVERLAIRAPDIEAPIRTLSGGNQQKFAVAKWLDANPRIIVLDEPTRGVDLGAKREMYRLIAALAAQGLACLVISSELPELLGLCHRIAVMRQGRIVGEVSGERMTEERIMHLAAGVEGEPSRRSA
jgi:ribose transport system ATP-binding protein